MDKYVVIFTNSYGKFAKVIEAEGEREAILKAITEDDVKVFVSVEAVQILFTNL
jgi:hypothetical protein